MIENKEDLTHTGDVTGLTALTIANSAVTLAKMANMATGNLLGRTAAGTGVPEVLAPAAIRALLNVEDGADLNDQQTKSLTIELPSAAEDLTIFYTPVAITVTEVVSLVMSATSVTWRVRHDPDRSAAGNLLANLATETSTTTGTVSTTFLDQTIPGGSFVWFETTAVVGTPSQFFLSIQFTEDNLP